MWQYREPAKVGWKPPMKKYQIALRWNEFSLISPRRLKVKSVMANWREENNCHLRKLKPLMTPHLASWAATSLNLVWNIYLLRQILKSGMKICMAFSGSAGQGIRLETYEVDDVPPFADLLKSLKSELLARLIDWITWNQALDPWWSPPSAWIGSTIIPVTGQPLK